MRDDFSEIVKIEIASRVGFLCSRPSCRASTKGPRNNQSKSVNIGVAAHIAAAAPGGPRYAPSMTQEERINANNGIWLCQNCAKLIDNDTDKFNVSTLREWKEKAEKEAFEKLGKTQSAIKTFKKEELMQGICIELKDIRIRFVGLVYILASHLGKTDKNLLNWILPYFKEFQKNDISDIKNLNLDFLEKALNYDEAELFKVVEQLKAAPNIALSLKTYSLPFLHSKMGDLSMFKPTFQSQIFDLNTNIEALNEEISDVKYLLKKTFDSSMSRENHIIVRNQIKEKYEIIKNTSRRIVDKIDKILESNDYKF